MIRRSWRLGLPLFAVFLLLCVVAPLGVGLTLRQSAGAGFGGGDDAWIGIGYQPVTQEIANLLGLRETVGILVIRVFPTSPAERGGLEVGDVIRAVDGRDLGRIAPNQPVFDTIHAGRTMNLTVFRLETSALETLQITAANRPPLGDVRNWTRLSLQGLPVMGEYPETWLLDVDAADQGIILLIPPSRYEDEVQIRVVDGAPPLDEWYREVLTTNQNNQDLQVISEESVTIAGEQGRRARISYTNQAGEAQKLTMVLIRTSTGRGYFLLMHADARTYDQLTRPFDDMVQRLSFGR